MMTLSEAMAFIHRTDWKGSRLGLARMQSLMHLLGDPQNTLKFVHVAGTNGKGSTCAILRAVLTAAGYKTGLYTSPHLWRVNERMAVDGVEISDSDLCKAAERVKTAADQMADAPTEFEILTAMAFVYFARQRCDIVVLEVGLGGRLDATNVIASPEAAVLCNIGLEHTEILGDTLAKIAGEKAGIIKEGCAVAAYPGTPEVEQVYRRICRERHAALHMAHFDDLRIVRSDLDGQELDWAGHGRVHLALLGAHQARNAAVVLETAALLRGRGFSISEDAVRQGFAAVQWPGRLEILSRSPLFIADGAHNPQCVETLTQSLCTLLPDTKLIFLMGILADKDYPQMLARLIPYARSFVCLTPDSPRALPADALAAMLRALGQSAVSCASAAEGIQVSLAASGGTPVVCCGSLYLLGEVRNILLRPQ